MRRLSLWTVVAALGLVGCVLMAGGWARGQGGSTDAGRPVLVAAADADGAAMPGVEGPGGKRGPRAAKPAAKARITLNDKEYVVSLIPVQGGKKGKKGSKAAVVKVGGKKYRVRIVPADRAGRKDKKEAKAGRKGANRRKGKAGKGKKR